MYLLFDIGGTHMRIADSEDGVNIKGSKIVFTPQNFQQGIEIFKQTALEIIGDTKLRSAAGGVAGPLNHTKSRLESSPQLPDWVNKPLKNTFEEIFKVPVLLENDAALAGLGEAMKGAGQGYSVVAYLTVSTGVGGAKIVDGVIDKNIHGFEPGQMIVKGGKLIDFISGMALEKKYGKKAEDIEDKTVWNEVAYYLAQGINNIIVDWSPNIVILGGSIIESIPWEKIETNLKENLTIFKDLPPIKKSSLQDQSGLYGALEYLKQNFPS